MRNKNQSDAFTGAEKTKMPPNRKKHREGVRKEPLNPISRTSHTISLD
ncbi:MAG: hypothetical protein QG666_517, partial [Euryarchaeota archaeon]|nr:hypothetical protein [Euryarchaeota archaeon]